MGDVRLALADGAQVFYKNKPVRAVNGVICICFPDSCIPLRAGNLQDVLIYPNIRVYR